MMVRELDLPAKVKLEQEGVLVEIYIYLLMLNRMSYLKDLM